MYILIFRNTRIRNGPPQGKSGGGQRGRIQRVRHRVQAEAVRENPGRDRENCGRALQGES